MRAAFPNNGREMKKYYIHKSQIVNLLKQVSANLCYHTLQSAAVGLWLKDKLKKEKKVLFCYHHHNYSKVTILLISRTFHWLYRPFPVAFSHEELKCCETAALSRIKLVLSKAHFILTTASGCIDTTTKPRLGISFSWIANTGSLFTVNIFGRPALLTRLKPDEDLVILRKGGQWCHDRCSVITVQLRHVIDFPFAWMLSSGAICRQK